MLKNLISRFQEKEKRPTWSPDAGLDVLMAEIPESDPRRLLFDIDQWFGNMDEVAKEIDPDPASACAGPPDDFAHPAPGACWVRYLTPTEREYQSEAAWAALDEHAAFQYRCYRMFILPGLTMATDEDKVRMARWPTIDGLGTAQEAAALPLPPTDARALAGLPRVAGCAWQARIAQDRCLSLS